MTQINHLFGSTLEFSCTVEDGEIISQELVSSTPDTLISFKLDTDSFLTAADLRNIADQIDGRASQGVELVTAEEADGYLKQAKIMFANMPIFTEHKNSLSTLLIAETLANLDGKTLYAMHVSEPSRWRSHHKSIANTQTKTGIET